MTKMMMRGKQLTQALMGVLVGSSLVLTGSVQARPPLDLTTGDSTVAQLKEDGNRYMSLGFSSLAIEAFRAAIDFENSTNVPVVQWDSEVPLNLGLIYSGQGDIVAARDAFERAVTADPESFKAHYQLGLAEFRLGNYEEARQQFQLLSVSANDPEMQAHLKALLNEIPKSGDTKRESQPSRIVNQDNESFEEAATPTRKPSATPSTSPAAGSSTVPVTNPTTRPATPSTTTPTTTPAGSTPAPPSTPAPAASPSFLDRVRDQN